MTSSRRGLLLLLAALAGLTLAELLYRAPLSRQLLARWCGLENQMSPLAQNLRAALKDEPVGEQTIEREMDLLRAQFGDNQLFLRALAASQVSLGELRAQVTEHARALAWIEKQIAPQLAVTDAEQAAFYETHRAQFLQPIRFRASHLFLAAPTGSPPELILAKQSAIQGLAIRLLAGESFAALAAEASEDERTKLQGGDLGWFDAARMPPEFIAEVVKLKPGEVSGPFQSHLGFHLVQLAEAKPAREMSFAETQPEIQLSLGNLKRALAVAQLQSSLAQRR